MNNNDLYLYHHGVPGMKWGKRKAVQTSGQGGRTAKKQPTKSTTAKKQATQQQADTQPTNSKSKKGWLIAGGILAGIAAGIAIRKFMGNRNAKLDMQKTTDALNTIKDKKVLDSTKTATSTLSRSKFFNSETPQLYRNEIPKISNVKPKTMGSNDGRFMGLVGPGTKERAGRRTTTAVLKKVGTQSIAQTTKKAADPVTKELRKFKIMDIMSRIRV